MSGIEFHIQALQQELGDLEREWENHDCLDGHDCKADEEEAHAAGYDEGRVDLLRELLNDVETWKRQAAVELRIDALTLDDIEDWLRRKTA